jgi:hypothetical protein
MITGFVQGQVLRLSAPVVAADTLDYLTAQFVFRSADWSGMEKWAHFAKGGTVYDIPLTDDKIRREDHLNLGAGEWKVYVHGNRFADGTVVERITTAEDVLRVVPTGALNGEPFPEMPASVTEQILARLEDIEQNGGGSGGGIANETDPTVPDWAKQPEKPKYTATEVGAATAQQVADLSKAIAELGGTLVEPAEDDIPKVFFGGALQQTKDEAVVPFRYISKTQDISGYAEIKAQGNSSMSYPKKNQTVKLYKDAECTKKLKVNFKGWGEQNKFCAKANWIDITHARNVVSARLWGDIVKSRTAYEELPELLRTSPNQGAVDGFPVKVYAAGVYQGRYTINIPKDKWMSNMDDDLDNHCILCGEGYGSGCFRKEAKIDGSDWSDEIHDTVPDSIKTRWNEVISFVMNSTDEEFKANIENYFFLDSLIDYNLFGLFSTGIDAYGKNQLYMTYDGLKWFATMYDMDSTWGLSWGGNLIAHDLDRDSFEDRKNTEGGNLLYARIEKLFLDELNARWTELKSGALSVDSAINRFERFTDIAPPELVAEDYAETTANNAFTAIPSKTSNTVQRLRTNIITRTTWVDEYLESLIVVPCTGISLSETSIALEGATQHTLTATVTPEDTTEKITWDSDNNAVAVVANGIVQSIGNGTCNITATCGAYSATCAVTVSGITTDDTGVALYPIADNTNTLHNFTVTNTNGNHFHVVSANSATTLAGNVLATSQSGIVSWDKKNETPWFVIPVGAIVEVKLCNFVKGDASMFAGIQIKNAESQNYPNRTITKETDALIATYTAATAEFVATCIIYAGNASTAANVKEIEFDMEVTVDGVRYV